MNDWMRGATYTNATGPGSFIKRNVADDTFQGLSPRGQGVMGAFGAGMTGAGNQMMGRPQQQFAAPRMDAFPEAAPAMPMDSPAPMGAPQQGKGAFSQGQPNKRMQFASGGFLDYLRSR
jgi:hypothetical protein